MARRLRLWENDPDSAPKPKKSYDTVGRFRSGVQLQGQATSLKEWRITTDDPDNANRIAETFGGKVENWDTKGPDKLEVYTTAKSIDIVLDSPADISSQMVLWSRNNKLVRSCDGYEQSPDANGVKKPCACPSTLAERKAAAREGTGCDPSVQAFFRIHGMEDMGKFRFQSGSWTLAQEVDAVQEALDKVAADFPDTPILASLALETVEYTPKQGPMAGRLVSYTKPVITVLGPVLEEAND